MTLDEAGIRLPLLGFTPDSEIWGFPDRQALTECGPRTLKENMQAGLELVDMEGRRWVVQSIRRLGAAKSGLAWLVEPLLYGKRTSRIAHDVEAMAPLTLAEVQERICASMAAFPSDWCDGSDEDEVVVAQRMSEVRAAPTIAAIHALLGLDDFRSY